MSKIVYNNLIPFKGFKVINLFGVLFARKGAEIDVRTINHERIHTAQWREVTMTSFLIGALLFMFGMRWALITAPAVYYIWYVIEWLVRLAIYRDAHKAYRNICFEREAYLNGADLNYLENREVYACLDYFSYI